MNTLVNRFALSLSLVAFTFLTFLIPSMAVSQSPGEDIDGFMLRDSLGRRSALPFIEHDELTFAERELLYGFSADPDLLEGPFVYIDHTEVRTNNDFEWPEEYPSEGPPNFLQSWVESIVWNVHGEWLTVDEFHRSLAAVALRFTENEGMHHHGQAIPEPYDSYQFTFDVFMESQWDELEEDYVDVLVFDLFLLD